MSEPKFDALKAAAEKIVTSMRPSERDVYEFNILTTPEAVMEIIEAYRALLHNYEVATKALEIAVEDISDIDRGTTASYIAAGSRRIAEASLTPPAGESK